MITAYFNKRKPHEYQLFPIPENPDEYAEIHVDAPEQLLGMMWDGAIMSLIPSLTLTHAANTKHTQINQWRDQQEQAPVEHAGHCWDADPSSRARIESVLLAGAMPLDYWTDADNVDRLMTLEQLRGLYAAIVQQGGRIHDRQRQMKAEVAALNTIEAVQAYQIGWHIEEPA